MQLILQRIQQLFNNVNVKVDGVKGDVAGLTKRVDRHDQRLDYIDGNIIHHSERISANEDAIKKLNGKIGTTITNVENTINTKIEANNTVIRNDINTAISNNNTVINKNIETAINNNNTTIINKVDKNIDAKIVETIRRLIVRSIM